MLLVVRLIDSEGKDFWFMQDTCIWDNEQRQVVELEDCWLLGDTTTRVDNPWNQSVPVKEATATEITSTSTVVPREDNSIWKEIYDNIALYEKIAKSGKMKEILKLIEGDKNKDGQPGKG